MRGKTEEWAEVVRGLQNAQQHLVRLQRVAGKNKKKGISNGRDNRWQQVAREQGREDLLYIGAAGLLKPAGSVML
jgi:hypothetical protein